MKKLDNEIEIRGKIENEKSQIVGSVVLLSSYIAVVNDENIVVDETFYRIKYFSIERNLNFTSYDAKSNTKIIYLNTTKGKNSLILNAT